MTITPPTTRQGAAAMIRSYQRRLQRCIIHQPSHVAQEAIREAAANHRADLRHLARRAEPVEPRHQRLLKGRRDGVDAALLAAALQEESRHFLDEQRHAAGAHGDILHHFLRQRVAGGKLRHLLTSAETRQECLSRAQFDKAPIAALMKDPDRRQSRCYQEGFDGQTGGAADRSGPENWRRHRFADQERIGSVSLRSGGGGAQSL
jgi:hypothetical protein